MGLRLVPQDDSSLVRREPGICRGPIRDGVKKGEEDGGPSGHHCARPLMNSSEPRNGGRGGVGRKGGRVATPRQETGAGGMSAQAGREEESR